MDLFEQKNISPMLLYQVEPFDDKDYIFELKLDGIRCIAYIDTKSVVLIERIIQTAWNWEINRKF